MIGTAIALAILTTLGFLIIYAKLPLSIKTFIQSHTLLTDALALAAIYVLLGGTLTALIAAAICGLFVSGLLYISGNKKEFLYLYDLYEIATEKLKDLQKTLKDHGEKYRQGKDHE
tara:strand:- start:281 stop:628 length:348 start_codon:yes stop_codon:yes gene_type:complete